MRVFDHKQKKKKQKNGVRTMFDHCRKCKEKRYPGCQDHCPDGIQDKKEYEEQKAVYNKKKAIESGLHAQRSAAIEKATKNQRH